MATAHTKSSALFKDAEKVIPGGVNSPVRACRSVGSDPLFIERANGAYIYDADGNEYIDYVCSWGPMILGHNHPEILAAVKIAAEKGLSYGAPTKSEIEIANLIIDAVPSIEKVRMVNSGTEATMSAIRLSRGFTDRDMIVKFDGCYHGHADTLLVAAGSGVATLGIPGSPGVPAPFAELTISIPYNDLDALENMMKAKGDKIACVILEPIAGNMGFVTPAPGFLKGVRDLCTQYGAVLIFDEVITGFRASYGGAQALFGVMPDLTTLGKIIGGGMPVGAFGGRVDIMEKMAPQGPVYQAGTLSGNPVAMAAGVAMLKALKKPGTYETLEEIGSQLEKGLKKASEISGVPLSIDRVGSMVGMFFKEGGVKNFEEAKLSDCDKFTRYYKGMRERGVYLAPSQFETGFVSTAHTRADIKKTIEAATEVLSSIA